MRRLLAASLAALLLAPAAALAQIATPLGVTNIGTTVTTGATIGVYTQAKAAETGGVPLRGCQITNTSAVAVTIATGPTPTTNGGKPLPAGATMDCAEPYGTIIVEQISVAPTTAAAATVIVWVQR